jgi:TetR/AcrR family transcriptional regulator, cholesterol catabolism regulator
MRETIIDITLKFLFENGIKSISMDKVSIALGISKKTIYKYFKNKKELIFDCVKAQITREYHQLNNLSLSANNSFEIFNLIFELYQNSNTKYLLCEGILSKSYPSTMKILGEYWEKTLVDLFYETLQKGKSEENFRDEMNSIVISKSLFITLKFCAKPSFSENLFLISDHFIRGIVTPKGLKYYQESFPIEGVKRFS